MRQQHYLKSVGMLVYEIKTLYFDQIKKLNLTKIDSVLNISEI